MINFDYFDVVHRLQKTILINTDIYNVCHRRLRLLLQFLNIVYSVLLFSERHIKQH